MKKTIFIFFYYLLFNILIVALKNKNDFIFYLYSNLYINQSNLYSILINIVCFIIYFILFYFISFKLLRKPYPYFIKKKQLQFIYWLYNKSFNFLIKLIAIYYRLKYYYHKLTYKTKLHLLFHLKFKNSDEVYLPSYTDQYDPKNRYIDKRKVIIPLVFETYSGAILSSNHTAIKEVLTPFDPNDNKLIYESLFQFVSIYINGKFLIKITKFELIWSGFLDHTHNKKILNSFKNIKELYDVHNEWKIYTKKQKKEYDLLDDFNSYLRSWKENLDEDTNIEEIIIKMIKGELDNLDLEDLMSTSRNHYFYLTNQFEIEHVVAQYQQHKQYKILEKYDFNFNKLKNKMIEFQRSQFNKIPDVINLTIDFNDQNQFNYLIDFFKTVKYYIINYNDENAYKIKNRIVAKKDNSINRKVQTLKRKLDNFLFDFVGKCLKDRPSKFSSIPSFYCYNILYFVFNLFFKYDQPYLKNRLKFYFIRCLNIEFNICLQIIFFSLICLPILYYIPNFIYLLIIYIYGITFKLLFQLKFKKFNKRMIRLFSFQIGYFLFYFIKIKLLGFFPLVFLYLIYYLFSFFFIITMILVMEFNILLENEYKINFFFILIERIILFLQYWYNKVKKYVLKKKKQIKEKLKQYKISNKLNEKS